MRENPSSFIGKFFQLESASGILMIIATACALIIANTPLARHYNQLLELPLSISIGNFAILRIN